MRAARSGLALHRRTGTPVHPMAPLPKLVWFAEQEPKLFGRVAHWVGIKDHVLLRLCGALVTDHSVASASGLPADTPVVVGVGDGPLANLGLGAVRPGVVACSIGTSGAMRVMVERPAVDPLGGVFCYLTEDRRVVGGAINNGGIVLQWAGDALAPELGEDSEEELLALAARAPVGSGGLVMLPYLLSERALLASVRSAGNEVREVRASGGFARSPLWRQMLADALGMPVRFPAGHEGSSFGAALLALAGLSVLHGLVPPHPGPLVAISSLDADLGLTLGLGLLIAVPTVIVAGPVFGNMISRYVPATIPEALLPTRTPAAVGGAEQGAAGPWADGPGAAGRRQADVDGELLTEDDLVNPGTGRPGAPVDDSGTETARRAPKFWPAVITVLLPVVLMLLRAIGELALAENTPGRRVLDIVGTPMVALLAGVIVAMFTLGFQAGFSRKQVSSVLGGSLPPIAGILLIVAAGGGFKQVLVDAGVGNLVADAAKDASLSPLLLGWLVAVGIRVGTGSATVATITAAGIVAPLAATMDRPGVALLALAIGCGSLFFSHVNDAGFWLVKEYFGLTVGQTIKSWSVLETIISVVGFAGVLLLDLLL
ncbi:FGGY-family carbohydrate kinase [Micromonospora carbonacea]|uniref:GntT/GntP/DsdX family permease n=1 Tax=Micromonospora carbonacea TaxID=47853 RepID=UPI00371605E0